MMQERAARRGSAADNTPASPQGSSAGQDQEEKASHRWDAFSPTLKQEVAQSFAHEAVNHARPMAAHWSTVNSLLTRLRDAGADRGILGELEDAIVQIQATAVDISALVASTTGQRIDFDRMYSDVLGQSGVDVA